MKGAIQLSLGFIVTVVFAVILLSLAIAWLQGIFDDISGLTVDLTQQSSAKIQEVFGETGENFAIWPTNYNIERGSGIKMLAGIKNNAPDGDPHRFVINVIPKAADRTVCSSGDINTCTVSGGETLKSNMETWITFDSEPNPITINNNGESWIEVKVPNNAQTGTYIFKVYSCYDAEGNVPASDQCDSEVDLDYLWGGSAKELLLSVK